MTKMWPLSLLMCVSAMAWAQDLPPGHPPMPSNNAPGFSELTRKLESSEKKTFENSFALGKLYFSHGEWKKAAETMDVALSLASAANAGTLPEAVRLGAHAHFLVGNITKAKEAYTRLATKLNSVEGHYFLAMLLIDAEGNNVASLKKALSELNVFLEKAPASSQSGQAREMKAWVEKAIAAGGISKLQRTVPAAPSAPVLSQEVIEAFQKTEVTADMKSQFETALNEAEEHLARGRFQEALNAYKGVMPYQPNNGRVAAGMAWSLIRLDKPMAPRVWTVAIQQHPASITALAQVLQSKGDTEGAEALRARMKETQAAGSR